MRITKQRGSQKKEEEDDVDMFHFGFLIGWFRRIQYIPEFKGLYKNWGFMLQGRCDVS